MPTAADIKLKAFDTVLEWSKLLITVASATLVLSATFVKDIVNGTATGWGWLLASWGTLLGSIVLGICVVGALSALLNRGKPDELDVFDLGISYTAVVQILSFIGGLGLFVWFVYINLPGTPAVVPSP